MNMMESLRPPSAAHLCGTDEFGRDVFSRIIYGARISLSISLSVLVLVGIFGTVLGMLAGFYHTADTVIMRFMDGLMAFPTVILALVILTVLGSGIPNLVLALSITQLPRMVRTVRTTVISAKQLEHVEAPGHGRFGRPHHVPLYSAPVRVAHDRPSDAYHGADRIK